MDDINADANGGFRRIEVRLVLADAVDGRGSEKGRIVAETLAPGTSVSEVARRWQVCPQQVFAWRREARAGFLALTDLVQTSFVPIVLDTADTPVLTSGLEEAAPKPERSSKAAAASSIEIKLAGAGPCQVGAHGRRWQPTRDDEFQPALLQGKCGVCGSPHSVDVSVRGR